MTADDERLQLRKLQVINIIHEQHDHGRRICRLRAREINQANNNPFGAALVAGPSVSVRSASLPNGPRRLVRSRGTGHRLR
jgi:hypothetical protein